MPLLNEATARMPRYHTEACGLVVLGGNCHLADEYPFSPHTDCRVVNDRALERSCEFGFNLIAVHWRI